MKLFYDPQTGLVSRWARIGGGVSYAGLAEHDAADIDDPLSVYVYAGAVHPLPARPGAWAVFDPAGGAWTDPRTPAEVAADDAAALAAARAGMVLTRRQVIIGMVLEGLISQAEGIAMSTTKAPPAAVETMLAAMPEPQQTVARITLADFTVAYRLDPMVALFQTAGGLTDAQMDAFFVGYAAV